MSRRTRIVFALCLAGLLIAAMLLPLGEGALALTAQSFAGWLAGLALLCAIAALASPRVAVAAQLLACIACAAAAVLLLRDPLIATQAGAGFWALALGGCVAAAAAMTALTDLAPREKALQRLRDIAVPALFGATLIVLAELIMRGAGVPAVLLPAPSAVAWRFAHALPMLMEDLVQTYVKAVLIGYALGNGAGFALAMLAQDRPFFREGVAPLAGFMSSLPIVGIAPIMVMWFGFDWESKAAVVAIVTFFPMFTNALAGLSSANRMDVDLLHSYAATPRQAFAKLRLPASLPFVFNALKINSTLAFIGAIVAEFFGTPVKGMGFRISIEAARMSMDVVWAEILLAALVGTASYACLVAIERRLTFWHPSQRG